MIPVYYKRHPHSDIWYVRFLQSDGKFSEYISAYEPVIKHGRVSFNCIVADGIIQYRFTPDAWQPSAFFRLKHFKTVTTCE